MTRTAEQMIPFLDESLDALESGDIEAFMAVAEKTVHPEVEFKSAILGEVEGTTYRGRDGARRWATDLLETAQIEYRDREHRPLDTETLLVLCRFEMRGRGSGAPVSRELGFVWTLKDGLGWRCISYLSHAEAIAAAEELVAADA